MLEDIEKLPFHTNQTPDQMKELEAMKLSVEELVNKDPQAALEKSEEYILLAKKHLAQEHLANYIYLYAALHYLTGKNSEALEYCKIAIKYTNNIEQNHKIHILLGAIYTYFGEFDKALEVYDFAIKTNNNSSTSTVYNNIAAIHFKQKNYNDSIKYLNKALELSDGNFPLILLILNNIGRAYIEQNDLENAEPILLKVEEMLEETENPTQEMIKNLNIGLLYYKQERYQNAYNKLLDAYIKCKELNLNNNLYSATLFLAHACSKNNKQDQANNYYLETLDLMRDLDNRLYIDALKSYLDFLVQQQDFERCTAYFIEYTEIKELLIKEDKEKEINALTVKFQNTEQKLEIDKLNKEKEFQKQLIAQAEEVKRTNEKLLEINQNLSEANDELMESKILRSQMNPHFIYNTINSISSLIKQNKNIEADKYLHLFSHLTRQVFDNNTKKDISLKEELDFCRKYIELEKLRFGNKIKYIEKIDLDVSLSKVKMPSMLIQPILENSIKHGVFHLQKDVVGNVQLVIYKKSNKIFFEISDNGIGLKTEISLISSSESALSIVNKRVNIFNKLKLDTKSIEINNIPNSGVLCKFELIIK